MPGAATLVVSRDNCQFIAVCAKREEQVFTIQRLRLDEGDDHRVAIRADVAKISDCQFCRKTLWTSR
jgi:hypothetical protein